MGRDVGATGLFFEMAVKVDALVDAGTHECTVHDTAYDGALEAEPRLLKQTRKFLLSQPAPTNQTFQACGVRPCDARTVHGGIIGGAGHRICPLRSNFRRIGSADRNGRQSREEGNAYLQRRP
jgi:hypothetical protein